MAPRQIATNHAVVVCDVCSRSLLRGEQADVFIAGGARRQVCELCTTRAADGGWIREGVGDDELTVRQRRRDGRGSLLQRLRARREEAIRSARTTRPAPTPRRHHEGAVVAPRTEEPLDELDDDARDGVGPEPADLAPAPEAVAPAPHPYEAAPTNADMKRARAVDLFNASEHPRTVAALARSLGAPFATVRPSEVEGSVVTVLVGWELCWYRYAVDLADEAAGVRQSAQGDELSELEPVDQEPNAAADERGNLHLVAG